MTKDTQREVLSFVAAVPLTAAIFLIIVAGFAFVM